MKKIFFITGLLAFAAQGIFAQEAAKGTPIEGYTAMSPAERAKDATDKLNEAVQLTEEQYPKILAINKEFYGAAQSGAGSISPAKAATDRDNKVKALLTPAQLQKLNAPKTSPEAK